MKKIDSSNYILVFHNAERARKVLDGLTCSDSPSIPFHIRWWSTNPFEKEEKKKQLEHEETNVMY